MTVKIVGSRKVKPDHYSVAQVAELYDALNKISNESNRVNRSLVMIARDARNLKVPEKSPPKKDY